MKQTNYNSDKPEKLFNDNGDCIGVLMPVIKNPGRAVQAWSKPGSDNGQNVVLADPSSVANFSDYFCAVHGKTYPAADTAMAKFLHAAKRAPLASECGNVLQFPAILKRSQIESPEARAELIAGIWGKQKKTDGNPSRFIDLTGADS